MTTPRNRYPDELPPGITADGGESIRTAAGSASAGRAFVTNRAPEPRILAVSFLGVDADWLPDPTRSRVLMPGETVPMDFTLHPAVGTLSAKYPFAITVQAIDPASGQAMSSAAIADYALVVDAPGRVEVQVVPNEITRRLRGKVSIKVTNVGNTPESVRIEVNAPENLGFTLAEEQVEVQPGASALVPARIAIEPQNFGRPTRYSYTVTARGRGAARRADAAITTRSIFGNTGPKFFAIVGIITLWAGLLITLVPTVVNKINEKGTSAQDAVAQAQDKALDKLRKTQTATPAPGAGGSSGAGSGGGSGSGGGAGSGGSGGGSGSGSGSGSGGSAAGTSATGAAPVQFSGTVAGDAPAGVTVSMRPTSLVDEEAQSASGVGVNTSSFNELGKIPAEALTSPAAAAAPTPGATTSSNRSTVTKDDGAWGFAKVTSPGYYLVTFAKPGFQSQRYVLDASTAAAAEPMKVTLVPGKGRLSGRITGPDGAVGGATITLSDGTNTLASSSNSRGDAGAWSVDGLSTPGTYLVTAFKDGLSTESSIVTLDAGGEQTANLRLERNSATLTGTVYGPTSQRDSAPLGNVSVTAKSESTERTSTTITTGNLTGTYRLPDLPAGDYVITTQAAGYLTQTRAITIKLGERTATLRTDLRSASSVVTGVVQGIQFDSDGKPTSTVGPVNGAGITLTSATNKYKVTTGSNGAFRLDGVAPGSYVLSAEFAGLGTAYADVEVEAGVPVKVPIDSLQLPAANQRDSSSITGFVAGATNPTGAIICPTDAQGAPTDCDIEFRLRNSSNEVVDTNTEESPPYDDPSKIKPIGTGPTPYSLFADGGLPAGVYRLSVSVEGYLAGTVTVRVPANTVATAPTASLFPTNGLVGSVMSTGNLSTDGPKAAGGSPGVFDSCVWAVPAPQTPAEAATPLPSSCPSTPANQNLCKTTGRSQAKFVLIDRDTQAYKLNGLCNGTYRVYAASNNPWYVSPSDVVSQTLFQGQTVSYSPRLVRDGKVELTVKVLGANGQQTPATNLTGTAKCKPATTTNDTSQGDLSTANANGVVVVDGVDAGNVTCTVTANDGYSPKTVSNISVDNESTSSATVVLTKPIGDLAGRLIASYQDKRDEPVKQVRLNINGIVDDGAGTKSVNFSVTTDNNGCFAITKNADGDVATGNARCATINTAAVAHSQALVSASVEIVSSGGGGFDGLFGTYTLTKAATDIRVTATPVNTGDVKLSSNPAGLDLSNATVTVTPVSGQANGAGTVSITKVDPDGTLTWQDSIISSTNLASPGKYTIKAVLNGYKDVQTTVTCPLARDTLPQLRCALDGAFVLVAKGGIQGKVSGVLASGTDLTYDRGGVTRSYSVETPVGLTVTARSCDTTVTPIQCNGAVVTGTVGANGTFNFDKNGTALTLDGGTYRLSFNATGYQPDTKDVIVTGGATATANQNLFLRPVKVTVQLQRNGTTDNYPCTNKTCTVVATRADTLEKVTLTRSAGTGLFTAAALPPASYQFDATGDDFSLTSFTQSVPRNDNPPATATVGYTLPVPVVNTSVSGSVTGLQGSAALASPLNGVTVELGSKNAIGEFVPGVDEDGNPLITKTLTRSGAPGEWIINAVTSGQGYFIRFNGKDTTGRLNGYRESVTTTLYNVARGQDNRYGTTTVTRVERNVEVSIATTAAGSDIGGSVLTLQSAANGKTLTAGTPSTAVPSGGGTSRTWTFSNPAVPFGTDWKLTIKLPAGHLGTVTMGGQAVAQTCAFDDPPSDTVPTPPRTCTLTNALTVSGADTTTPETFDYVLDEYQVNFTVKRTQLTTDPSAADVPATVALEIKASGTGTPTVYKNTNVSTANTAGSFWGADGSSYTSTVTGDGVRWAAADVTFARGGSATKDIDVAELSSTVTITVSNLPAGATGTLTLALPNSATTVPVSFAITANGDSVFTKVPYYQNVRAKLIGTKPGPNNTTVPLDEQSAQIDIDSPTETGTVNAG